MIWNFRIEGKHVVRLTYIGEISGEPVLDEDHSKYKWFTLGEIKRLSEDELDIYFKKLVDEGLFDGK